MLHLVYKEFVYQVYSPTLAIKSHRLPTMAIAIQNIIVNGSIKPSMNEEITAAPKVKYPAAAKQTERSPGWPSRLVEK